MLVEGILHCVATGFMLLMTLHTTEATVGQSGVR